MRRSAVFVHQTASDTPTVLHVICCDGGAACGSMAGTKGKAQGSGGIVDGADQVWSPDGTFAGVSTDWLAGDQNLKGEGAHGRLDQGLGKRCGQTSSGGDRSEERRVGKECRS